MSEKFDIIVAGSGVAGLAACLEASKHKGKSIALLDRFDGSHSNSFYAQGGIACALAKSDSWKKHYNDTLSTGAGLCDKSIVEMVTRKGPEAIGELMSLGLEFDGSNEKPEFGLEGGHSEKRVLHIKGDQTGKEITRFMRKLAEEQKNIQIFDGTTLAKALLNGANKAILGGIICSSRETMRSNAIVLATGGYAACWEKTTNPETTLGSGIAIAEQAGCGLAGMEFVQFHPTTLRSTSLGGNFLVSEAVRGEGGKIVDENCRQIVDPLSTRDKVSRAIYNEIAKGKRVFLDARDIRADFKERFPMVYSELAKNKIDPETDLIPIEAASHYTIGGIKTNENARSSMRGIYAAGECSCSGMHGANRLASNSLLESLVIGKIAGENAISERPITTISQPKTKVNALDAKYGTDSAIALMEARRVMWNCCGILRETKKMQIGLAKIKSLEKEIEVSESTENYVARGALLVSRRTIEAALARNESIGCHYREL